MDLFLMKVIPPNRSAVNGRYEVVLTTNPGFPYSAHLDGDQLQSLFHRLPLTEDYRSGVMEVLRRGVEYHTRPICVPDREIVDFGLEAKQQNQPSWNARALSIESVYRAPHGAGDRPARQPSRARRSIRNGLARLQ